MKRLKDKLITIVLLAAVAVGVGLLAYPSVSDWWNSTRQTHAVASYSTAVTEADDSEREQLLADARAYNERLAQEGNSWILSEDQLADYESQLALEGTQVMGYVDIPKIRCTLPIYHGTDEAVLQVAVGHIEGSSLPVGGQGSHCVISGHRGLPSARLFTDLDQLVEGDTFTLTVMGQTLTYEVDQILIVEPDDVSALCVVPGEDFCTLVTCTPYGVNTHRLLVRGHRVADAVDGATVSADAVLVEPEVVALCLAVPVVLVLFVVAMVRRPKSEA